MNTWNSQTVTDQLTSMLAERRRFARDRRSAYLALARAIVSDRHAEQLHLVEPQPSAVGDWRSQAA